MSDSKGAPLKMPLHMQRIKHPNVNGSPWGWLVDHRGERVATYSGWREEEACERLLSRMAYDEERTRQLEKALEEIKAVTNPPNDKMGLSGGVHRIAKHALFPDSTHAENNE